MLPDLKQICTPQKSYAHFTRYEVAFRGDRKISLTQSQLISNGHDNLEGWKFETLDSHETPTQLSNVFFLVLHVLIKQRLETLGYLQNYNDAFCISVYCTTVEIQFGVSEVSRGGEDSSRGLLGCGAV